jgi:serine/threonine-protein kinase
MGKTITRIGRYEISRQLVDTALASVYDAFDPVERKSVAIRVPRTTHHGTGALPVGLKHPGLMTVLSCEENQGEPFLVLEPFEGMPLDSQIPVGRKMEPVEVLGLLRQLASALDYAHAHGSVHGSLHPSSILLNDRRQIKVLDLGPTDATGPSASAEQLLRAVHFLSPECLRDLPLDGRSDQFSLAVLAHRMLTGELPFPGTPLGVMFRIAYQGLERDAIRDLPAAAQTVFQRSLAKRPAERYATCGEMVEALENAIIRRAPAPTRLADASQFAPARPVASAPAPLPVRGDRSWAARNFSREALTYFGITFAFCALILAGVFYLLLPKAPPRAVTVAPMVTQPAARPAGAPPAVDAQPVPSQPAEAPAAAAPPVPSAQAKPGTKSRIQGAKKKAAPEVELKPVEPKIVRQ